MKRIRVLGIDPGVSGSFVLTDGFKFLLSLPMPIEKEGKDKRITLGGVMTVVSTIKGFGVDHIFLERAIPMAMGAKSAFNYGRGFQTLVDALEWLKLPVTYVEPQKWAKEMHEGISGDLKAKAKSLIAVKRLYPHLVGSLPLKPKGGLHDGPIDALLIAGYGLRKLGAKVAPAKNDLDFY